MQKRIALVVGMIFTLTIFAACQRSKPSPAASATCNLGGGKTIKTDYSSPRAKGRKIYGGLVPYGEVWRTGANEATTFVTSADVVVGGKDRPRRQLHDLHRPQRRQVDAHHQQKNWRMGHSLQV